MAGSATGGQITAPAKNPRSTIMSGARAPMMGGKGGGQAIAPSQGFNVNQASAGALQGAMLGTAAGMGYRPQSIAQTDLSAYTNPFETQVVNQSLADIERSRLMQQNQIGLQAGTSGAYGGSRHGIAEAETNRAFADQAARTAAGLRQAGFQNAQQLAGQDITTGLEGSRQRLSAASQMGALGQQAFNTSGAIQDRQQREGLLQQGLQQALINAAQNQFQGYASSPTTALAAPLAALGVIPTAGGATTSSSSPGLFDYLGLGAGLYAASDIRLKENIRPAGKMNGIKFYTWDWNEKGKKVAAYDQPSAGVIADEIQETHPHLVKRGQDGYLRVNYAGLASEMAEV